jgi:hypothetical protein
MSVSFTDIRTMIDGIPAALWMHEKQFDVMIVALRAQGILFTDAETKVLKTMARIQNKSWPSIRHPRATYFASSYAGDEAATQKEIQKLAAGDHAITRLCALTNADLRVYEMDITNPAPAPGLTESEAAHALSYGLMAVDEKVDTLVVAALSAGADAAMQAVLNTLSEKDADVLAILARYTRHDLCALVGAAVAACMAHIPVICGRKTYAFLEAVLKALRASGETPLMTATEGETHWPDTLQPLRMVQKLKTWSAAAPQDAKNVTHISEAA